MGLTRGEPTADPTRVRFAALELARLERLVVRIEAQRSRGGGAGGARELGRGEEWIGSRPYAPGDDLRQLDWPLLARTERAYVRETRRESSEHWGLVLDTSASLGLGVPGKLQAVALHAAAFGLLGLRRGAALTVVHGSVEAPALRLRRRVQSGTLLATLQALEARGRGGLGELCAHPALAGVGRLLLLGDLAGPPERAVLAAAGRGRDTALIQVLAPAELAPPPGAVVWLDPEERRRLPLQVSAELQRRYDLRLSSALEAWGAACLRHGLRHLVVRSDDDFERGVLALFGRRRSAARG
jgi:uncharacterized protein (DUF58 family)